MACRASLSALTVVVILQAVLCSALRTERSTAGVCAAAPAKIPLSCSDGQSALLPNHAEGVVCEPRCPVGSFGTGGIRCVGGAWTSINYRDVACLPAPCPRGSRRGADQFGAKCTCKPGLVGNITWTEGRYWSGSCGATVCNGKPPTPPGGVQQGCGAGASTGTTCILTCNLGFELNDHGAQSRCLPSGKWSKPGKSCRRRCMGPAPSVDHGVLKYCTSFESSPGTKCQLECEGQMRPSSGDVTFCGWDGYWKPGTAVCQAPEGTCPTPPRVRGGVLVGENCTAGARDGMKCELRCDETRHKSAKGAESECKRGSWTPTTYKCVAPLCNELPPAILGGVQLGCGQFSKSGTRCNLSCFKPYQKSLTGVETVCQVDGTWSTEGIYTCGLNNTNAEF